MRNRPHLIFFNILKKWRDTSEQPACLVSVTFSFIIWVIECPCTLYLWSVPSVEGVSLNGSPWRPPAIRSAPERSVQESSFVHISFQSAAVVGQPPIETTPKAKRCALDDKIFGRTEFLKYLMYPHTLFCIQYAVLPFRFDRLLNLPDSWVMLVNFRTKIQFTSAIPGHTKSWVSHSSRILCGGSPGHFLFLLLTLCAMLYYPASFRCGCRLQSFVSYGTITPLSGSTFSPLANWKRRKVHGLTSLTNIACPDRVPFLFTVAGKMLVENTSNFGFVYCPGFGFSTKYSAVAVVRISVFLSSRFAGK